MLLRGLRVRLGPTKSILVLICILITICYYFASVFFTHGRGYTGHTLQRDLVSHYLWPYGTTTPTPENTDQACRDHGFTRYQRNNNSTRPRRVYDLFPFHQELDWLEIRLRTLAPFVDYFVITEYTTTFTGI
jgi:hypothetical protein